MLLAGLLASDSTVAVQNKHFDWPIMHLDLSRLLGNLLALKFKINSPVRNELTLVQFHSSRSDKVSRLSSGNRSI